MNPPSTQVPRSDERLAQGVAKHLMALYQERPVDPIYFHLHRWHEAALAVLILPAIKEAREAALNEVRQTGVLTALEAECDRCSSIPFTDTIQALTRLRRVLNPVPPIDTSDANLAYISSLKPGEQVIEMGQSAMYGACGTVYESDGDTCVRWWLPEGSMGTSVTWGTRRISDVKPEDMPIAK